MLIRGLLRFKIIDDDFIFNILCCDIYETFLRNHRFNRSGTLGCPLKGGLVLYDVTSIPKPIFKMFGIGKQPIRNKVCLKIFLTKLKLNQKHLKWRLIRIFG